jgi:hypothetical protein
MHKIYSKLDMIKIEFVRFARAMAALPRLEGSVKAAFKRDPKKNYCLDALVIAGSWSRAVLVGL